MKWLPSAVHHHEENIRSAKHQPFQHVYLHGVNGAPLPGYSSGDAIKAIQKVAAETLPAGYGYEFAGLTRSEQSSSNSTAVIFLLCIMFVYFILSAQYESYILPLTVILSLPFGFGRYVYLCQHDGCENNIYLQIALIMLIGCLPKNAILITEFALEQKKRVWLSPGVPSWRLLLVCDPS